MRTWGIFSFDEEPSVVRRNRVARPRGAETFAKPALPHQQLLQLWSDRGLIIPDPARAERYLRHIGYYRLSPYTIPYQVKRGRESHEFRDNTSFDQVLDLYVFDRQLRLVVLDAVERVEVAVRALVTDVMSEHAGPQWYTDPGNFISTTKHSWLIGEVAKQSRTQLEREPEADVDQVNHKSALEHYLTTYGTPELPASWVMMEMLTIGQLQRLFSNIRDRRWKSDVARSLGLQAPVLESWLKTYVRIRNICAHHGRLWNVGLGVAPVIPKSQTIPWLTDRDMIDQHRDRQIRLYPVLVSLQSVLTSISPGSSWCHRLKAVLDEHPDVPRRPMGLFEGWENDPFWAEASERARGR